MARKSAAFKIRIEEVLRQDFLTACQANDLPAAQVVRKFMRDYVARHRAEMQGSLFSNSNNDGRWLE